MDNLRQIHENTRHFYFKQFEANKEGKKSTSDLIYAFKEKFENQICSVFFYLHA